MPNIRKFQARTMWGWIAGSLGGKKGYEILRSQDEGRIAPGGDKILELLAEGPNLILLDETLQNGVMEPLREADLID